MHFQRNNVLFLSFCVAASVSISFGSAPAVTPGSVWEKFLPPEYSSLIHPSKIFSSKKKRFSARCDDYVLIEDGKMSLCLDKVRGKKTIMFSGKELVLSFSSFWQWISDPESRFEVIPQLVTGCPFKIHGVMKAKFLSPDTHYSAYVVYKAKDRFHDFGKSYGTGVIVHETREGKKWERQYLTKLEKREDGWMEVKFGEFLNEGGFMDEIIEFHITEIKYTYWKPGFIIQGIEFLPVKKLW